MNLDGQSSSVSGYRHRGSVLRRAYRRRPKHFSLRSKKRIQPTVRPRNSSSKFLRRKRNVRGEFICWKPCSKRAPCGCSKITMTVLSFSLHCKKNLAQRRKSKSYCRLLERIERNSTSDGRSKELELCWPPEVMTSANLCSRGSAVNFQLMRKF